MAKTDLQIQSFLSENTYRNKNEWELIASFCSDKAEVRINIEINPQNGISAADFLHWYENGFGAGDVAKISDCEEDCVVVLGKTSYNASVIAGKLSDDKILISPYQVASDRLKMASEDEIRVCRQVMLRDKIQFSWKTCELLEKYIPCINERIIFHGEGIRGLGIVRDVDMLSGDIELYCYYIYTTKRCGFSMHEKGICNLHDYSFEPISADKNHPGGTTVNNHVKKLNTALGKHGKIWSQPRHRIEPVHMKVGIGETYWYFNDRLELCSDVEKGNRISHLRAVSGNYFYTPVQGTAVLGKIILMIQDYLASPESNRPE